MMGAHKREPSPGAVYPRERGLPVEILPEKGDPMAVKVLITRELKQGKMEEAYKVLMELRSAATLQQGYLSGETMFSADNPNKLLVISTWTSRKRWENWLREDKRKKIAKRLEPYLTQPEQVEVFLSGDKIPEWVDMA